MNQVEALNFIETQGVVLESAKGPVPSLAHAIAGEFIKGSWWAHPSSHEIWRITRALRNSEQIRVCRLVEGKITYVLRRRWPALITLAQLLPPEGITQVREINTESGKHVVEEVLFPNWVPASLQKVGSHMSQARAFKVFEDLGLKPTD